MEKGESRDDVHTPCRALIDKLQEQIKQQQQQIEELKARLNKNSRNSSKPPSSNPPWITNTPPKTPGERPPGGQPGHPGHSRAMLPPNQVSEVVEVKPKECRRCGRLLRGTDPQPLLHQVTDLPPVVAETL